MSEELDQAMTRLQQLRGVPSNWIARSNALSRHIAELPDNARVLAVGEYRSDTFHAPAALIYDDDLGEPYVNFVRHDSQILTYYTLKRFHSTVPHKSIAREVFIDRDAGTV